MYQWKLKDSVIHFSIIGKYEHFTHKANHGKQELQEVHTPFIIINQIYKTWTFLSSNKVVRQCVVVTLAGHSPTCASAARPCLVIFLFSELDTLRTLRGTNVHDMYTNKTRKCRCTHIALL